MPNQPASSIENDPRAIAAIGISTKQAHHIGVAVKAAVDDSGALGSVAAQVNLSSDGDGDGEMQPEAFLGSVDDACPFSTRTAIGIGPLRGHNLEAGNPRLASSFPPRYGNRLLGRSHDRAIGSSRRLVRPSIDLWAHEVRLPLDPVSFHQ